MRFDLDIVYLDRREQDCKGYKIVLPVRNAVSILEIPSCIVDIEML